MTGVRGARWTQGQAGGGNAHSKDTQNVFRHVPGSLAWSCAEDDESPFGESRGGTPTVVRPS